jgi:hypothetical protein
MKITHLDSTESLWLDMVNAGLVQSHKYNTYTDDKSDIVYPKYTCDTEIFIGNKIALFKNLVIDRCKDPEFLSATMDDNHKDILKLVLSEEYDLKEEELTSEKKYNIKVIFLNVGVGHGSSTVKLMDYFYNFQTDKKLMMFFGRKDCDEYQKIYPDRPSLAIIKRDPTDATSKKLDTNGLQVSYGLKTNFRIILTYPGSTDSIGSNYPDRDICVIKGDAFKPMMAMCITENDNISSIRDKVEIDRMSTNIQNGGRILRGDSEDKLIIITNFKDEDIDSFMKMYKEKNREHTINHFKVTHNIELLKEQIKSNTQIDCYSLDNKIRYEKKKKKK